GRPRSGHGADSGELYCGRATPLKHPNPGKWPPADRPRPPAAPDSWDRPSPRRESRGGFPGTGVATILHRPDPTPKLRTPPMPRPRIRRPAAALVLAAGLAALTSARPAPAADPATAPAPDELKAVL